MRSPQLSHICALCDEVSAMEDCDPVIKEWVDALVERLLGFSAMLYVEDLHFLGLLTNDYDKYVGARKAYPSPAYELVDSQLYPPVSSPK